MQVQVRKCLPAAALLIAACASANPRAPLPGTPPMPTTDVLLDPATGRGYQVTVGVSPTEAEHTIEAGRDTVWRILPLVYEQLGIPVATIDPSNYLLSNVSFRASSNLGDQPISAYLNCGARAGVASIENNFLIQFSVLSTLAAEAYATRIKTVIQASARDPFASTNPMPCSSLGKLEASIAQLAAWRLGVDMGTRLARALGVDSLAALRDLKQPQLSAPLGAVMAERLTTKPQPAK